MRAIIIGMILFLAAACAYPQALSTEVDQESPEENPVPKTVPKIFNTPPDVEVNFQPSLESIRPAENQEPQKEYLATAESVAYYFYYPGAYYYPLRYRWNPYHYYWWL
ncbi:uncharacterized protein LOC131434530 [Malaya genurostris]|uniref:uncharacterized protein LOC131434530 n=1 Tax=Malaya genurostris TaxID=325434 RepID=UPI0026F3D144|nr:uncharacterized protein LOC131434530 [Malaya genurostris]